MSDLIIKGAGEIKDGLYNIKDGKLFKYKANGGTVRTYPIVEAGWIPCSERLPKKDGRYQVTRYDYVTNTEFIDILWYEENLWWDRHSAGDYAVTAWMPLPEPFVTGGEEE